VGPLLALLALAMACSDEAEVEYLQLGGGVQAVVHPVQPYRLSSHTDVPVVRVSLPEEGGAPLPADLAPLATFDEASAVGVLEATDGASSDLVFGTLTDAEVAPDGTVLLLDGSYSVVRVLSPSLEPVDVLGGEGEGPGEFDGPGWLFWVGPDEFGVLGAGRIEVFRQAGGTYEYSRRIPVGALPSAEDACFTPEHRYVEGLRLSVGEAEVTREGLRQIDFEEATIQPEVLHEIGAGGDVLRSFSAPYQVTLPYENGGDLLHMALNLTNGPLACRAGVVWAGYSLLGEVHALGEDGALRWITRLMDLGHPGLRYMWDASGQRYGRSGIYHVEDFEGGDFALPYLNRVILLSDDVLAAQVRNTYYGPIEEGQPQSVTITYRTYLLDPEDGHFLGGFTADHQILGGGNGTAVLYRELLFPQISVVRLGE